MKACRLSATIRPLGCPLSSTEHEFNRAKTHDSYTTPWGTIETWRQLAILAGAISGAALGSKLLFALDYAAALVGRPAVAWLSGKTIVGALLGGLAGVELSKKVVGWSNSTGDSFVWPLLAGISLGRIGCQLSGVDDLTYGIATRLPWGWNYGDGIPRHPTGLYEIAGLAIIALLIHIPRLKDVSGDRFRAFMVAYLLLRLLLDFLKPPFGPAAAGAMAPTRYAELSAIQWACIGGLLYYSPAIRRWLSRGTLRGLGG